MRRATLYPRFSFAESMDISTILGIIFGFGLVIGAMGQGGEIFMLEMGAQIRIADMARDLIRLYGLEPDRDIPIEFVGLRPGEKLYEELITEDEWIVSTDHQKIRVWKENPFNSVEINRLIDELLSVTKTFHVDLIKKRLKKIVPEYSPQKT